MNPEIILHIELTHLQVHPYAKLAWNVLTAAQKVGVISRHLMKMMTYHAHLGSESTARP
jgi:hypothetical protein